MWRRRLTNECPQRHRQHPGAHQRAERRARAQADGSHFKAPEHIRRHSSQQAEHCGVTRNVGIVLGLPQIRFDFGASSISNRRRERARTAASRHGRTQPASSCGRPLPALAGWNDLLCRRFSECAFTEVGEAIQAAQRPSFARRLRALPSTRQHSHFFEASERAVQRAVGGQSLPVVAVSESLGERESVEFPSQTAGGGADLDFEWKERPGFSSHAPQYKQISAYVKPGSRAVPLAYRGGNLLDASLV